MTMPMGILLDYAAMSRQLRAEEALLRANTIALGMGTMDETTAKEFVQQLQLAARGISTEPPAGQQPQQQATVVEQLRGKLAGSGIGLVIEEAGDHGHTR